ncbi:MAG TPA: DNA gyrase inhibitor YacG [Rhodospirillales bacterium]|jgi:hypothetical protein|nr:DNA gyrase inhibitor YacG [Rhodospirillales bacterium]
MAEPDAKVVPLKSRRCPTCRHPTADRYRPFCSRRCADLDLGSWLNEDYRIASSEEPDTSPDEDEPGPE